jgi:hypothetical protein
MNYLVKRGKDRQTDRQGGGQEATTSAAGREGGLGWFLMQLWCGRQAGGQAGRTLTHSMTHTSTIK